MKTRQQGVIAYHYTIGLNFSPIIECGYLDPEASHTPGKGLSERSILWFSADDYWEPTANKGWVERGVPRVLSMEETIEIGRGGIRFGYPAHRLYSWADGKLQRKSRMPPEVVDDLNRVGKDQGANPSLWYGANRRIQINDLSIEALSAERKWELVREAVTKRQKS